MNIEIIENYVRKENYIAIAKKPRLENKIETEKENELLTNISTNNITDLNELIYACVLPQNTNRN